MSDPFVGEIRIFAGTFAPRGWAFCDGQLLSVSDNDALFSLFGTIYGGDGRTTFGLPDLRGRLPIHAGSGPGLTPRSIGSRSGSENVAVTEAQLPSHSHPMQATESLADSPNPGDGKVVARSNSVDLYVDSDQDGDLNSASITSAGGGGSHTNVMPFLCVNFIVALFGVYPSRT